MVRDAERIARIAHALEAARLDAIVCTLPSNVLLASAYWPVIGNGIAIATRDARIGVLAPEDEESLAADGWPDVIHVFSAASLDAIADVVDIVRARLPALGSALSVRGRVAIGFEGAGFDPSVYASGFAYGASLPSMLSSAFPDAVLVDATHMLAGLKATLTPRELSVVRTACGIAHAAFETVAARIGAGMTEHEVADLLRRELRHPEHDRADGFAYCMSGPNSARAYAAFQQSTSRPIEDGDQALLHCNSCCGGFWTDITRTFSVGTPSPQIQARLEAIFTARQRAIAAVRPGVTASTVDRAARSAMSEAGFEDEFVHPAGHGVGFAAIDHHARPRIHPHSDDVLEVGMTFNIEPAAYLPASHGIRHCDMVVVTDSGAELLTPFLGDADHLRVTVVTATNTRTRTV
jgi:Xaa-Pro aminopeptidase